MSWFDKLGAVEALEDAPFDAALVAELECAGAQAASREIRFSTPTFKSYSSCDVEGCGKNSFPAFSVTAGGCALDCDHCQAKILEPMIPATNPEMLERKVRELVATQDLQGFLLSGGSTKKNEIRYERYYPVLERLKRDHPKLKIAIHSALLDAPRARAMAAAGVDTAMMDVIGSQDTIRRSITSSGRSPTSRRRSPRCARRRWKWCRTSSSGCTTAAFSASLRRSTSSAGTASTRWCWW